MNKAVHAEELRVLLTPVDLLEPMASLLDFMGMETHKAIVLAS